MNAGPSMSKRVLRGGRNAAGLRAFLSSMGQKNGIPLVDQAGGALHAVLM